MWRATEEFGLEFNDLSDGDDSLGVWDGEKFLITVRPFAVRVPVCRSQSDDPVCSRRLAAAAAGGTP